MLWKLLWGSLFGLIIGAVFALAFAGLDSHLTSDSPLRSPMGWTILSSILAGAAGAASVRSSLPANLLEWAKKLSERLQADYIFPLLLFILFLVLALFLAYSAVSPWLTFGILGLYVVVALRYWNWKPPVRSIQPPQGLNVTQHQYEKLLPGAITHFAYEVYRREQYGRRIATGLRLTVAQLQTHHPQWTAPVGAAAVELEIVQLSERRTAAQLANDLGGLEEAIIQAMLKYVATHPLAGGV